MKLVKHLRANVVAYVALFFALGIGTAWALERNSVRSKHIKDTNVREADLGPEAVTVPKLGILEHSSIGGTSSTTSPTPVDTSIPGPTVTIDVPDVESLVAVYAEAAIRRETGTDCRVLLTEADLTPASPRILASVETSFTTMRTLPGSVGAGTDRETDAGWLVFPANPGPHTYKLQYAAVGPSGNCTFTNRDLYVAVVG